MATTTQITNIADKLDIDSYAGEFAGDMKAVYEDYVTRLNEALPRGVTLARNGDVYAIVDLADEARDIDWDELIGSHDPADLFERHDLLTRVAEATKAVQVAEKARVDAIRAAKYSRYTVEAIAEAAGITRDGVYKLLGRAEG